MGEHTKDISDGYHTFGELYEHRHRLFLTACRLAGYIDRIDVLVWYTTKHHPDNDPMFMMEGKPGILAGLELPTGSVQYHMPARFIPHLKLMFAKELLHGPYYSGSDSPENALNRLLRFLED